jgi:hypothetical protein
MRTIRRACSRTDLISQLLNKHQQNVAFGEGPHRSFDGDSSSQVPLRPHFRLDQLVPKPLSLN